MKKWNERLADALRESGKKKIELAAAIGIAPASLSEWLNGTTKEPGAENIAKACKFLGIEQDWLFGNSDQQYSAAAGAPSQGVIAITARAIPLSATIHGEHIHEGEDEQEEPMYYQASWITKMGYKPEMLVSRQVRGSSMEPALHDGDTVLINCASRQPLHGRTFWVTVEGEACVKRLLKLHGSWWVSSDNPAHKVRDIQLEDPSQIMGEVVIKSSSHI